MKFEGRYGNDKFDIADYKPKTPLRVKNDIVGIIRSLKIKQSSYEMNEACIVTITFKSANEYNKDASIVVEVPYYVTVL
jgi:hypothetical protein